MLLTTKYWLVYYCKILYKSCKNIKPFYEYLLWNQVFVCLSVGLSKSSCLLLVAWKRKKCFELSKPFQKIFSLFQRKQTCDLIGISSQFVGIKLWVVPGWLVNLMCMIFFAKESTSIMCRSLICVVFLFENSTSIMIIILLVVFFVKNLIIEFHCMDFKHMN